MASHASFSWHSSKKWPLKLNQTVEQIVEEAIYQRGKEENCPLVRYHGHYLRYDPNQGYYSRIDQAEVLKEISEILPQIDSGTEDKPVTLSVNSKNARAASYWLETVLTVQSMEAETAIAFKNGTLYYRNKRWELGEHSPDNKLTYAIQGDWKKDCECPPYFKEFVRTGYGLEWLNILRGVFPYHADPRYGCSVITMIIGNSGTGKGVTERLMEKVFSSDTVGVITSGFKDLNSPEKVSQFVAGKRFIVFSD